MGQSQQPARLPLSWLGADELFTPRGAVELCHGAASHHDLHASGQRQVAVARAVSQTVSQHTPQAERMGISDGQADKGPWGSVRFLDRLKKLRNGKVPVQKISDQHAARRMGNA